MTLETQLLIAFYLMWAALLGMVIGLERERRQKSAGMRTHMLVSVGACLFTALSTHGFHGVDTDTSRVAANVVTGIGFLGAGIIFKSKREVHDLTTAASIWATAAVGMTVAVGGWFLALVATLGIWFILAILRYLRPSVNDHSHIIEPATEPALHNGHLNGNGYAARYETGDPEFRPAAPVPGFR